VPENVRVEALQVVEMSIHLRNNRQSREPATFIGEGLDDSKFPMLCALSSVKPLSSSHFIQTNVLSCLERKSALKEFTVVHVLRNTPGLRT
jgi:hypothetical protein